MILKINCVPIVFLAFIPNFFFTANTSPGLAVLSGLVNVAREKQLYIEVGVPKTFSVNGSDDGTFTYRVYSTMAGVIENEVDGTLDITVTNANTDPQLLR